MQIKKVNKSKYSLWGMAGIIFMIMLLCNMLTDKCVDDYAYLYSYADGTRITDILDVFPSMVGHYSKMNGRLIAHFFVQFFLFLPPIIFKVLNSAVFVLQIFLLYKICNRKNEHNALLFLSIFGLVWIFQPAFGQVNLWLDGACNYLWCVAVELIYIIPFINKLVSDKNIDNKVLQILFIVSGFIAGAYSENASPASIFMVFLFIVIAKYYKHYRLKYYHYCTFIASLIGFIFMMAAPAEWNNKATEFSFGILRGNFMNALEMYEKFKILLVAFIILFVLAIVSKVKSEIIATSVILILGSICTNFIMAVASYFPERSAFFAAILLIAACGILSAELFNTKYCTSMVCIGLCILLFTFYYGCIGVNDIYVTHAHVAANESYIVECKNNGISDISVPMVTSQTKYSAFYKIKYLDTSDPTTWPNIYMSRYYDVDSIIGYWE